PNWDLIGPGDAYVKALAAGRPANPMQLRPEAPQAGSFVLLRGGREADVFRTLAAAIEAAKDGDTVEIRTDGPVAGLGWPGKDRLLTVRASPGYTPAVKGGLGTTTDDRLILEGLAFQDYGASVTNGRGETLTLPGRFIRVANCSFPADFGLLGSFAGQGDSAAEVVNCRLSPIVAGLKPGARLRLSNCVLELVSLQTGPEGGERSLDVDRCLFWNPDPRLYGSPGYFFGLATA